MRQTKLFATNIINSLEELLSSNIVLELKQQNILQAAVRLAHKQAKDIEHYSKKCDYLSKEVCRLKQQKEYQKQKMKEYKTIADLAITKIVKLENQLNEAE